MLIIRDYYPVINSIPMQTLKEELKKILPEKLQPQFDHLYDEYQYQVYTFYRSSYASSNTHYQ